MCSNNCGVIFFVKIYFSFREMTFFVRSLKYANFHREYYPSCVTSKVRVLCQIFLQIVVIYAS